MRFLVILAVIFISHISVMSVAGAQVYNSSGSSARGKADSSPIYNTSRSSSRSRRAGRAAPLDLKRLTEDAAGGSSRRRSSKNRNRPLDLSRSQVFSDSSNTVRARQEQRNRELQERRLAAQDKLNGRLKEQKERAAAVQEASASRARNGDRSSGDGRKRTVIFNRSSDKAKKPQRVFNAF